MNNTISFLQTWGIILVVLGHSFYYYTDNNPIYTWIYTFHMPLFIFISGYLLKHSNITKKCNLQDTKLLGKKGFILKKTKRLLIPYFVISSIAFIPKCFMSDFAKRSIDISFDSYINMLIYPWDNVIGFFWFLPTLFFIFLVVIAFGKIFYMSNSSISIKVLTLILLFFLHIYNPISDIHIFNLSGIVDYFFYFMLGYYCCEFNWNKIFESKPYTLTLICGLISIIYLLTPTFYAKDIFFAINGIALSFSIGIIYIKRQCTFLNHLFGASYAIYLFSWFFQVASQQLLIGVTHLPWWIGSILAFITGIYIPLLIYHTIQRNRQNKTGKIIAFLTGL